MQNFTTSEAQTSFFTWNVRIIFRIIFKMSPNTDFTFALSALSIWWYQFERNRSFWVLLKEIRMKMIENGAFFSGSSIHRQAEGAIQIRNALSFFLVKEKKRQMPITHLQLSSSHKKEIYLLNYNEKKSSNLLTKIVSTSFGVLPSTLIPFTSITSSPTCIKPDRSAAPPCIIRAMIIFPVSSSVFIVAPCKHRIDEHCQIKWSLEIGQACILLYYIEYARLG